MPNSVRRVYVEKRREFNVEAQNLYSDLTENLGIDGIESVRIAYSYDIMGLSNEEYTKVCTVNFKSSYTDEVYHERLPIEEGDRILATQYIAGQYDQRADATAKTIEAITLGNHPVIRTTRVIVLKGQLDDRGYDIIRNYIINPVESIQVSLEKPKTLITDMDSPKGIDMVVGFKDASWGELKGLIEEMGYAMDMDDLLLCQQYFRDEERRNPTITEMRMIDTYWSDHCRHTTFLTELEAIDFEGGFAKDYIANIYGNYLKSREYVYGNREKDMCLMDIATIAMKEMRKRGKLEDLDESEEINACSIVVRANVDGQEQEWLVMFKNETHNHPTEIEPFGGASTCLGGAIRDPLSGRSYVYQAMRITGSGDPRRRIHDTLEGKLPQRKITNTAAAGYSSYGNQIGLPAGQVVEIYDPGYVAKRMELGAVVAAAPRGNVVREVPMPGDVVILVGGRTGRDGCGGATGSSKAHTEESMEKSGAEVQKGNPAEERKIQRLFRKPEVSTMIKRCNDFGAGGVSVAIGELAPGLLIDLDSVPQKYEGLDGTEIAISESQERMAVVVSKDNEARFIAAAEDENLEATKVAVITEEQRLKMRWRGNIIVDISRRFLDTNGATKSNTVMVTSPDGEVNYFKQAHYERDNAGEVAGGIKRAWISNLEDINICSQIGLIRRFDSTIGAGTVLMPLGGKHQLTPAEGMVAKLPVLEGDTITGTIMAFGYNPKISRWSPFHGAVYAVVEAIAKITAIGGDYRKVRLSLQEYFERLGKNPRKWGKPFSALLGAYYAQMSLGIPAIGGKDSMSGTFNDISVPPTLVAFGVTAFDVRNTLSPEFKRNGTRVVLIPLGRDEWELPKFEELKDNYKRIQELVKEGKVLSAHSVRAGGVAEAVSKMAFGNRIGFRFRDGVVVDSLFSPDYGSIVLELEEGSVPEALLEGISWTDLGITTEEPIISIGKTRMGLDEMVERWQQPLEDVFPTKANKKWEGSKWDSYTKGAIIKSKGGIGRPRIFIPIFPGTASEFDLIKAFDRAGGEVETLVFRNLNPHGIKESIKIIEEAISRSQIVVVPSSLSIGDEMEKTGGFATAVLKHPQISDAIKDHLKVRDGLMLGLGGGFEALLNLGLIVHEDVDIILNPIGHHLSHIASVKITSNLSPWFSSAKVGDIHTTILSHREGSIAAHPDTIEDMAVKGQIATQFVDGGENFIQGIEGLTSRDGRVLGRLGYSERFGDNIAINIPDKRIYDIFKAGVLYFK